MLGCSIEESGAIKAIIDEDSRTIVEKQGDYIGILLFHGRPLCNAFVSKPGEITTAAHCYDNRTAGRICDDKLIADQNGCSIQARHQGGWFDNSIFDDAAAEIRSHLDPDAWQDNIVLAISQPISASLKDNPDVAALSSVGLCATGAYEAISLVGLYYQASVCSLFNVGAPACVAFIQGHSSAIALTTCGLLCQNHTLKDCK